jgi:hypothetical protein
VCCRFTCFVVSVLLPFQLVWCMRANNN